MEVKERRKGHLDIQFKKKKRWSLSQRGFKLQQRIAGSSNKDSLYYPNTLIFTSARNTQKTTTPLALVLTNHGSADKNYGQLWLSQWFDDV